MCKIHQLQGLPLSDMMMKCNINKFIPLHSKLSLKKVYICHQHKSALSKGLSMLQTIRLSASIYKLLSHGRSMGRLHPTSFATFWSRWSQPLHTVVDKAYGGMKISMVWTSLWRSCHSSNNYFCHLCAKIMKRWYVIYATSLMWGSSRKCLVFTHFMQKIQLRYSRVTSERQNWNINVVFKFKPKRFCWKLKNKSWKKRLLRTDP